MPPLYALSLPALGGLRLRQGEEDVRKLTPEGLLLRTCLPSLPTGGNKAPSPPSPCPLLLPVRALSRKKPLQPVNHALHKSRNKNFLSLVRERWRRTRLTSVSSWGGFKDEQFRDTPGLNNARAAGARVWVGRVFKKPLILWISFLLI